MDDADDNQPATPEEAVDPEAVFAGIDKELAFARILGAPVIVTWWLLVSNVVLWIGAKIYGLVLVDDLGLRTASFNAEQLVFYTGMKVNAHVAAGDWWRLVSSMWVHLDFAHIAFNAYGLYVLGPILEKFYGGRRFWALYLASGLCGAWASYTFNEVPAGGASGAIYGLVGALLVFGVKYRGSLPPRVSRSFTVGMLPWVALSIGIGFLDAIPLDNAAHIGGLVSGGLLALVLGSRLDGRRMHRLWSALLWIIGAAGIALVLYTGWQWSEEFVTCTDSRPDFIQCYPEIAERI